MLWFAGVQVNFLARFRPCFNEGGSAEVIIIIIIMKTDYVWSQKGITVTRNTMLTPF